MSLTTRNLVFLLACMICVAHAQSNQTCPRYPPGSVIPVAEDLYSTDGVLTVNFTYQTVTGTDGNTLFCFTAADGSQSPTLHVNPGDTILMTVTNQVAAAASLDMPGMHAAMVGPRIAPQSANATDCNGAMTPTSVNVHFHGTNTPATCHQDEVIFTIINSGESFQYRLQIPANEPPGLYWYHPHVHGIAEAAVLGGASGAIVVEGLQNVNAAVAGLAQQILIVRDNRVVNNGPGVPPFLDLSLNYVPVPYPSYPPALISMNAGERQLWRVLNASADTILDLQLTYGGQVQPLEIVALDGVPTGSQDGVNIGATINQTDVLIPPAGRAEFIVTAPASTANALLSTLSVNTGPSGFNTPARPLASIRVGGASSESLASGRLPQGFRPRPKARFKNLASVTPAVQRQLYFSENGRRGEDFITVKGQTPKVFSVDNPPAIVTTVGSVEDWTIENQTGQNHEFHIHQIHFLLMARNGMPVANGQYLDTIDVPFWSGTGPYPSVTLRMDFRGVTPANFVYHCHILAHEDAGMMAVIQVVAATPCDVTQTGPTNLADAQQLINEGLGLVSAADDLNHDGVVNVTDVQIVINAALGLGCAGA